MTAGEATIWVPRGAGISCSNHVSTYLFAKKLPCCDWTYSDSDGTALSTLLDWQGVGQTKVGTPVSSSDGDNAQLGNDDGGADSSSDFLGSLNTETDVTLGVTNDDNGLESSSLTGTGLLLDGLDLYLGNPS